MQKIDYIITFLLIVKVLFVLCALARVYLEHKKGENNEELIGKIEYWKDRFEFIFIAGMSLLLLYFFFPRNNKPLVTTFETRFLFFVYGILVFINLDWKLFFSESKTFKFVQTVL
jgi:cbb3-type cytochrome oxidase subunit 3